MRSSTPGAIGRTPTVSPSRSTVARWQRAAISRKRWEMKTTARPASAWARTTARTRSARSAGRAAVISSRMSTSGSWASARARSRTRWTARGRSRARVERSRPGRPRAARPVAEGRDGRAGQAEVVGDVEVGDQRRLLVDRHQAGAAGGGGRADVAGLAADEEGAGVGADRAGQDLDERRLAGAVRAHQRVDLAGEDRQRRVAEGGDGAVALGHSGGVEDGGGGHAGGGDGGGHAGGGRRSAMRSARLCAPAVVLPAQARGPSRAVARGSPPPPFPPPPRGRGNLPDRERAAPAAGEWGRSGVIGRGAQLSPGPLQATIWSLV